jgi:protoheme IX farnesyltransferase
MMVKWIKILLELTKFRISLFSTLSTFLGLILARQALSVDFMFPILGVFFLASGACGLNQYQERNHDPLMERTHRRPIPSKRLSPSTALKISLGFLFFGSILLYIGAHWSAVGLGLFAVFWYNGVYLFLKRKSAFAAIPGALIGAIPPFLGWISGKGSFSLDPQILAISFFFFIWQVPHFWLLLLKVDQDYEKAGLPSLTRIMTRTQLSRMTFVWIVAAAVTCMMIPLFGIVESQTIHGGLFLTAFWLMWRGSKLLTSNDRQFHLSHTFRAINSYAMLVMILLSLDHWFH